MAGDAREGSSQRAASACASSVISVSSFMRREDELHALDADAAVVVARRPRCSGCSARSRRCSYAARTPRRPLAAVDADAPEWACAWSGGSAPSGSRSACRPRRSTRASAAGSRGPRARPSASPQLRQVERHREAGGARGDHRATFPTPSARLRRRARSTTRGVRPEQEHRRCEGATPSARIQLLRRSALVTEIACGVPEIEKAAHHPFLAPTKKRLGRAVVQRVLHRQNLAAAHRHRSRRSPLEPAQRCSARSSRSRPSSTTRRPSARAPAAAPTSCSATRIYPLSRATSAHLQPRRPTRRWFVVRPSERSTSSPRRRSPRRRAPSRAARPARAPPSAPPPEDARSRAGKRAEVEAPRRGPLDPSSRTLGGRAATPNGARRTEDHRSRRRRRRVSRRADVGF